MGMLKMAPVEVLTVCSLMAAVPCLGNMIPWALIASAVLIIAPRFLTSLIWSNKINIGVGVTSNAFSTSCSIPISAIGELLAITPWWLPFFESLFSFSIGT